jgi:hypothetical protein
MSRRRRSFSKYCLPFRPERQWPGEQEAAATQDELGSSQTPACSSELLRATNSLRERGATLNVRLVNSGPCDKASPYALVMLHLRARYVSKAAILTLPIRLCRSEIEVPLEFQGLGPLRRRVFGDGFTLASLTA